AMKAGEGPALQGARGHEDGDRAPAAGERTGPVGDGRGPPGARVRKRSQGPSGRAGTSARPADDPCPDTAAGHPALVVVWLRARTFPSSSAPICTAGRGRSWSAG